MAGFAFRLEYEEGRRLSRSRSAALYPSGAPATRSRSAATEAFRSPRSETPEEPDGDPVVVVSEPVRNGH